MADRNPVATATTTTGRQFAKVRSNSLTANPEGGKLIDPRRCKMFWQAFIGTADNAVTVELPRGALAFAWQANGTADIVGLTMNSLGQASMNSLAGPFSGSVYCLYAGTRDSAAGVGGDDTSNRLVFPSDKSVTPDGFTNIVHARKPDNLHFQVFPFNTPQNGDIWKCTTGTRGTDTLCPGIVAVAWQGNSPLGATADRVAATLNASGDVVFNLGAGTANGWLWVWRVRT